LDILVDPFSFFHLLRGCQCLYQNQFCEHVGQLNVVVVNLHIQITILKSAYFYTSNEISYVFQSG